MSDADRLRALAGEHLPDGVASPTEFVDFFRHLLRRADADVADELDARVVCWLTVAGVHHHVVVRDAGTGVLRDQFELAVATPVCPSDLNRHAEHLSQLLTAALNLDRSTERRNESPDANA